MKICGIYKITSPTNSIYIGQSINIISRWNEYKRYCCKGQSRLYNSLLKHGHEKHKFEILCQCDRNELDNLEIFYVNLYQSFNSDFGMNLKEGGGSRGKVSDETKLRLSISHKGKKWSDELRIKRTGGKHTKEHKEKISKALKGRIFSKNHCENLSKANIGNNSSEETRKKMSEARKGKSSWCKGMKMSEEYRRKLSEAHIGLPSSNKGKKLSEETKRKISETLRNRNKK